MSIREYVIAASVMIFILWLQFVMLLPLNKKTTKKEKIIIMLFYAEILTVGAIILELLVC